MGRPSSVLRPDSEPLVMNFSPNLARDWSQGYWMCGVGSRGSGSLAGPAIFGQAGPRLGCPQNVLSQSLSTAALMSTIARRAFKSAAHESSPPEQAYRRGKASPAVPHSSRESEDSYQNANWTPFPSPSSNEGNKIHASQAACPESSLRPSSLMSSSSSSYPSSFSSPSIPQPLIHHSLSPIHHRVRTEVHAKQLQVAFPGRVFGASKRTRCWSLWAVISRGISLPEPLVRLAQGRTSTPTSTASSGESAHCQEDMSSFFRSCVTPRVSS